MKRLNTEMPKERIAEFCRKWGIREFALFGSALRNDFRPDSDIDILVSFCDDAKPSLFDMVRMKNELEEILGREVDIVTRRGIESSRNYLSTPGRNLEHSRGDL